MKLSLAFASLAIIVSKAAATLTSSCQPRHSSTGYCENTAANRTCWGNYSIEDDYYTVTPSTGVTREYWLVAQNTTLAPDGYERYTMNFNGTIPGPTIEADWGDTVIVHITNKLQNNGTAIHMHGIRNFENSQFDGVPGVTQCPIAPGETFTYTFRATQYGSTWYHSHDSLQYSDGLLGPIVINGPASANYDEDLGPMMLTDWFHESVFSLWDYSRMGAPALPENGLINGTNTFDCTTVDDDACLGTGKRNEIVFVSESTYRLRLINTAIAGSFRFHIDNHTFSVIAMDLVPIVPYTTDSLVIANGQRYDIVITANQKADNYWLRAIYDLDCRSDDVRLNDIRGIIRYDPSSTEDPISTSPDYPAQCIDEDPSDLVPYVSQTVGSVTDELSTDLSYIYPNDILQWTLNSSSLFVNWSEPTLVSVYQNNGSANLNLPTDSNALVLSGANVWVYFIIQDTSGTNLGHPMHLHGHDFFILASAANTTYDAATADLSLVNPPRRDTAVLPGNGYLVVAFMTDNPGAWLFHCHVAWHASEGMGLQFLERGDEIVNTLTSYSSISDGCASWDKCTSKIVTVELDAGI